jgi:hypothetical protein
VIRGTSFATLRPLREKNTRDSRDTWKRKEKILSVYDFFLTLQYKYKTRCRKSKTRTEKDESLKEETISMFSYHTAGATENHSPKR